VLIFISYQKEDSTIYSPFPYQQNFGTICTLIYMDYNIDLNNTYATPFLEEDH